MQVDKISAVQQCRKEEELVLLVQDDSISATLPNVRDWSGARALGAGRLEFHRPAMRYEVELVLSVQVDKISTVLLCRYEVELVTLV